MDLPRGVRERRDGTQVALVQAREEEFAAALARERPRLVRLCARLTGDFAHAEDLAQETLYEAWRHADRLREPAGLAPWLAAIARNVCLRWARGRGRELARVAPPGDDGAPDLAATVADDRVLEVELEREELARLLDRALDLLPPATRAVLVERYIAESPQAEVAARLGLSEGAVAMRLSRGRLALRRLLATELRHEAAAFGLFDADADGWQETRIWCPECGRRRLVGRFAAGPEGGEFLLRCPDCCTEPGVYVSNVDADLVPTFLSGLKGYRAALSRMYAWTDGFYHAGAGRPPTCPRCGHPATITPGMLPDVPASIRHVPGLNACCPACGWRACQGQVGLALALPEAQRFWREQRRIRVLPPREEEVGGRPALVTSFERLGGGARLDVVTRRDTLAVVTVVQTP